MPDRAFLTVLSFVVFSNLVVAQTKPPSAAGDYQVTAEPRVVTIAEGTPVRVRLTQALSTAKAHAGDTIDLEVMEDVFGPDREVVIQKGAKASGHVVDARPARRMGRRGTLALSFDSVESIGGQQIPVKAAQEVQGASSTEMTVGRMVVTGFLVGAPVASLWLLKHGKDAQVAEGTSFLVLTSKAATVGLNNPPVRPTRASPLLQYQLEFLHGDTVGMQTQLEAALNSPYEDILLSAQSDTESYFGHLVKARGLTQRAVDSALGAKLKERAAVWQANGALHEAELGDKGHVRESVHAALALSSSKDVEILAALAFARAGDAKRAQGLANKLEEKFRADAAVNMYWLPIIGAAIALDHSKAKDALRSLQPADLHQMDTPPPIFTGTLK